MSLLLDALHRASKDKEKAALAAANAAVAGAQADGKIRLTPPPGQVAADFPPLAPAKEVVPEAPITASEPPPPHPSPSVAEPMEFEFELEPAPFVAVEPVHNPVLEGPQAIPNPPPDPVASPSPPLGPLPKTPPAEPLARAGASASEASGDPRANPAAAQSAKPASPANSQAAASAIQKAYATPASGKAPRGRRAMVLGGVATCLALGLGSFLFGLWGDPERLLGLTGTSSVAVVSSPSPVQVPAPAPEPAPSASVPALSTDPPTAVTIPANAVVAGPIGPVSPVAGTLPSGSAPRLDAGPGSAPTAKVPAPVPTAQPQEVVLRPTSPAPVFTSKVNNQGGLEQGYSALLEGRLDDAALAYGAVLAASPMERDALLGLAYVAHSKGRREEAQTLYRKVLRLEPSNSVANAGLIALEAGGNGASNSDRAKALAARQPDSAAVQALAASALVQDGLLAEAALAFSRAQVLEPNNPWHSYNLAVALDRLGNHAQALEQYDKALLNKGRSPTPLGTQQIESARLRATQLQQSLEPRSEATE